MNRCRLGDRRGWDTFRGRLECWLGRRRLNGRSWLPWQGSQLAHAKPERASCQCHECGAYPQKCELPAGPDHGHRLCLRKPDNPSVLLAMAPPRRLAVLREQDKAVRGPRRGSCRAGQLTRVLSIVCKSGRQDMDAPRTQKRAFGLGSRPRLSLATWPKRATAVVSEAGFCELPPKPWLTRLVARRALCCTPASCCTGSP